MWMMKIWRSVYQIYRWKWKTLPFYVKIPISARDDLVRWFVWNLILTVDSADRRWLCFPSKGFFFFFVKPLKPKTNSLFIPFFSSLKCLHMNQKIRFTGRQSGRKPIGGIIRIAFGSDHINTCAQILLRFRVVIKMRERWKILLNLDETTPTGSVVQFAFFFIELAIEFIKVAAN